VIEAVAGHHEPGLLPGRALDTSAAVHIADALAHEVRPEFGDGTPPPSLNRAYLEQLGVVAQLGRWRALARAAADAAPAPAPPEPAEPSALAA